MSTRFLNVPASTGFGGVIEEYLWNWENQELGVIYETLGQGSPLLLLPAFSTVSSRLEMGELAKLLAPHFQVVAVDWPGFGESDRANLDYKPALYHQFLADFVRFAFKMPISVVAAGHAAGYVLQLAFRQPDVFSRIVLAAPTWRGPLPTMGASQQIAGMVRGLVRSPLLGQAIYQLNTSPSFLSFMYGRHVFTDATKLTPSFIKQKWQTTQIPGARFGSAAFVTGNIDPVRDQSEFLTLVRSLPAGRSPSLPAGRSPSPTAGRSPSLSIPLKVIIGESSPPKSRLEMDALAALPNVSSVVIPGSLGLHEEYPDVLAEAILPFLKGLS